ncbi:hypothetical protein JNW91_30510 [Micromonospora sp. STR1_7]|uniref:Uncharacterized protein n=1 Tax=Micromonospora parastrephiae TaxID=2806101 RepID=A0ABS1Y2H2_9ACTN|nr:hypothetical protein [Micromonospora parastrephiae]
MAAGRPRTTWCSPGAPDRPANGPGTGDAAVPLRDGAAPAPAAPPAFTTFSRGGWPPAYYLVLAGVLAVLALLLLWRRPAVAASNSAGAPAPAPTHAPESDPGPVPDNVSRLPTNLNAIYELGRLDERLDQERRRRP